MTEWAMTAEAGHGPGEAAERARRRRRLRIFGALFAAGLPVGFFAALLEQGGGKGFMQGTLPPWFAVLGSVVMLVAVGVGTWLRHRGMDELDRRDNLVAGAMGGNVVIGGYPLWFLLWKGGLVGPPDALWLFVATFLVSIATYGILKYRQYS